MGTWGYKPFQNDEVLDDIGGFTKSPMMLGRINKLLDSELFYGSYEATALLVSTYKEGLKQEYIIYKQNAKDVIKLINKISITKDESKCLYESSEAWISACAIDAESRARILRKAVQLLKETIDCKSTKSVYIDNMKKVYDTAQSIINSNYKDAIEISPQQLLLLINADNKVQLASCDNLNIVSCGCGTFTLKNHRNITAEFTEDELKELIISGKIHKPDKSDGIMYDALIQYFNTCGDNNMNIDNITDKYIKYARCIDKKYKNKKLQECLILDRDGKSGWVSVDKLKYAMRYHGLKVDNLKLTSDNRLITLKN